MGFDFFVVSQSLGFFIFLLSGFIFIDLLARIAGYTIFYVFRKAALFVASLYLFMLFPLTFLLTCIKNYLEEHLPKGTEVKTRVVQDKVLTLLAESGLSRFLSTSDQKLISSCITFREKVAREIMIPRVNLFCLSHDTTIEEAGKRFIQEDYSRVPIYKDSLDEIMGVLMYKDILKVFAKDDDALLKETVAALVKPVLYAPENKKIAQLFQEFRKKQIHMAIIVNEYGGTEGIVTIEDILEELVGEIEDEYDIDEKRQYWKLPSGSYIVDAKMSLGDVLDKLHIHIPPSPEYETIGGYIFYVAGTIPTKGWALYHDDYKMEVLLSTDRCIEKIRVTPMKKDDKETIND